MDIIKRVSELTKKLRVVEGLDELSKEAQNNATLMFFSLLRCMLASRRVLEEHKLTDRSFNWLLGEVETRFNQVSHACLLRKVTVSCQCLPTCLAFFNIHCTFCRMRGCFTLLAWSPVMYRHDLVAL